MRKTYVVLGATLATALAVACSSTPLGPVLYIIDGGCPSVPVDIVGTNVTLNGSCNLGQAGAYTLSATLPITIGACGPAPVSIIATWTQSSTEVLYSSFSGAAFVGCNDAGNIDVTNIPLSGIFTFDGGTGQFADAFGAAVTDGGVAVSALGFGPAVLTMNGVLSY